MEKFYTLMKLLIMNNKICMLPIILSSELPLKKMIPVPDTEKVSHISPHLMTLF
jgi:hypothetical protein